MKNWVGLVPHPTDEFVHWHEQKPVDKMNQLRQAYDKITELGLESELKLLLQSAYNCGQADESDANNPDI